MHAREPVEYAVDIADEICARLALEAQRGTFDRVRPARRSATHGTQELNPELNPPLRRSITSAKITEVDP
jgi:hypothetical protein